MKKTIALLSFFIFSSAILLNLNWLPLQGAKISFKINGPFGKDVKGTLSDFKTEIEFYPENVSHSNITASVEASTIDTKNNKRDRHLKGPVFFDTENFATIRFVSKSFRKLGEYFIVEGELTLKDVTRPVTIPFEFITSQDTGWFRGDFEINRLDYHVGKKSRMMGNKVAIHLDIPVLKN